MEKLWTIGEIARLFQVSADTLRYYEKQGLLSPKKKAENGYRNYVYEDTIALMEILFFRTMELPIRQIRQIMSEASLGDLRGILQENEQRLEKRIDELRRLQALVRKTAQYCALCEAWTGKFRFIEAPSFRCKWFQEEKEDLLERLHMYRQEDIFFDRLQWVLKFSPEQVLAAADFDVARGGLGVEENNLPLLSAEELAGFLPVKKSCYLYTIVGTRYTEKENAFLQEALRYLHTQNRKIIGPMFARYLVSEHKDGFDYYEIWMETEAGK